MQVTDMPVPLEEAFGAASTGCSLARCSLLLNPPKRFPQGWVEIHSFPNRCQAGCLEHAALATVLDAIQSRGVRLIVATGNPLCPGVNEAVLKWQQAEVLLPSSAPDLEALMPPIPTPTPQPELLSQSLPVQVVHESICQMVSDIFIPFCCWA